MFFSFCAQPINTEVLFHNSHVNYTHDLCVRSSLVIIISSRATKTQIRFTATKESRVHLKTAKKLDEPNPFRIDFFKNKNTIHFNEWWANAGKWDRLDSMI